jgi:hypothetical protein
MRVTMRESNSPNLLTAILTDCHATAAVGRNLQKLGHEIESKAEEQKRG